MMETDLPLLAFAAFAAMLIVMAVWALGYRSHRIELATGRAPWWSDLLIFGVSGAWLAVMYLFWENAAVMAVVFIGFGNAMAMAAAYYAGLLGYLLRPESLPPRQPRASGE